MPCRKQAFNRMTKELNLTEAYIPFDTNHIYHAWIENVAGNVISKTCIYNHKQSTGLANALDKELLTVLNNKKYLLNQSIKGFNNVLTDVFNNLYAASVPMKNLDSALELEIVKYADSSYFVTNPVAEMLYDTVLLNVANKIGVTRANRMAISKTKDQIYVIPSSELDVKVVTKSYDLSADEVNCKIHYPETYIDLEGDYMAIYLINEHIDKVFGLVVLDCKTYRVKALGFNVEVGDR